MLLARGFLPADAPQKVGALFAHVDWSEVLRLVVAQQVLPMAYRNLTALGWEGVPPGIKSEMRVMFSANALRMTVLAEELARLLGVLTAADVPVIPIKGPLLAQSLYGDVNLRVCVDLDLLVPMPFVIPASEVMRAAGYAGKPIDWFFRRYILPNYTESQFVRRLGGLDCLVEVQWTVLGWPSGEGRTLEDLWAEAVRTPVFGVPARVLSAEWQFIYLAVHAARHYCFGLRWLVDVDEAARRGLDWMRVQDKIERFGFSDVLRPVFGACRAVLNTPLPPELTPDNLRTVPDIFSPPGLAAQVDHFFRCRGVVSGRSARAAYMVRRLFEPSYEDREIVRLPEALGFLYYATRLVRLALKLAARTGGLAKRRLRARGGRASTQACLQVLWLV